MDPLGHHFFATNGRPFKLARPHPGQESLQHSAPGSEGGPTSTSFEALLLKTYLPESMSLLNKDQLVAKNRNYLS